jgi:phage-related protein
MAYERFLGAFDSISEYFLTILEFFQDLPDLIEGFFSSFFSDIKTIINKIEPTEKLNSIGNTLKGFGDNVKDTVGGVIDDAENWLDEVF